MQNTYTPHPSWRTQRTQDHAAANRPTQWMRSSPQTPQFPTTPDTAAMLQVAIAAATIAALEDIQKSV